MVESEGAEVLVLHGDHAAGPRHVHHLAEDGFGVPHVEEHGDRENAVEAIGRKAQPRAVSHRVDEARPEAGTAGETARRARHDLARIHAYHLSPRSHQACGISSDDAGARADLQHALAAADSGEAEEAPSETRLGGGAAARLEVADVALGLALAIDGAVGIEGAGHAKCCGRISRNRARSPPSASYGATWRAALRTPSGACGMAIPSPAASIISRSFSWSPTAMVSSSGMPRCSARTRRAVPLVAPAGMISR